MATVTMLPTAVEIEREGRRVADPDGPVTGRGSRGVGPRGSGRPVRVIERRSPVEGHGPRPVRCDQSYEPDLHGSRLTARGKVVVAALWLAMVAVMGVMLANPAETPRPAETATVVVGSGDTLWGIAEGLVVGADRRETIAQIMDLNGLATASDIHPGDILVVPVEG